MNKQAALQLLLFFENHVVNDSRNNALLKHVDTFKHALEEQRYSAMTVGIIVDKIMRSSPKQIKKAIKEYLDSDKGNIKKVDSSRSDNKKKTLRKKRANKLSAEEKKELIEKRARELAERYDVPLNHAKKVVKSVKNISSLNKDPKKKKKNKSSKTLYSINGRVVTKVVSGGLPGSGKRK